LSLISIRNFDYISFGVNDLTYQRKEVIALGFGVTGLGFTIIFRLVAMLTLVITAAGFALRSALAFGLTFA
jgi:hypothetical protein